MSQQNPVVEKQNQEQNAGQVEEAQRVQQSNQQEIRQPQHPLSTNGHAHNPNNQHPQPHSPSSQAKNSNSPPANSPSNSPSSDSQQQQQQKSDNVDENKSENDQSQSQEQSNVKSDDKDQDEDRSGDDTKKEEPSGKKCFNKLCNSKKIYKKLRSKVFLCRPCYQNYCNNDFCEFCQQIYSSTGNADDDDQWIGCDECNRWNHIECEKKYRNTNIHETKDQDTPYLCLTCTFKFKKDPPNEKKAKNPVNKENYSGVVDDSKLLKQKLQISKEQRVQIFNRKNQSLPSLEYFLQNYNFRLWINENLIKDDLETLRQAAKRNSQDGKKGVKKVKVD